MEAITYKASKQFKSNSKLAFQSREMTLTTAIYHTNSEEERSKSEGPVKIPHAAIQSGMIKAPELKTTGISGFQREMLAKHEKQTQQNNARPKIWFSRHLTRLLTCFHQTSGFSIIKAINYSCLSRYNRDPIIYQFDRIQQILLYKYMSQLAPKKSALKLKTSLKSGFKQNPQKQAQSIKQLAQQKSVEYQQIKQNEEKIQEEEQEQGNGFKTEAQKAHTLVKKKRLIQKIQNKMKVDHKSKLEAFKRNLSKQPDHYDLAKIGEKIQKGY